MGTVFVKGRWGGGGCFVAQKTARKVNTHISTLQRQNTANSKQIFPEKEYRGLSPNFHIHVSVRDLYIPTIGLPLLLEEICVPGTI